MGLLSFNHYVPRDIVDLLLHEKREAVLGLDETEVTIMFSELRNFSDVCEGIDPESVVAHLSDYLDEMMRAVQDTSGLVDKFIGDIVMAFWNAPKRCANHRGSALRTALECQDRLVKLQRRWRGSPFAAVKAASSVHSGVCLVGNLGSPDRLSFTCIGDSVNLTSRLNGLNKVFGTAVITSGQVRDTVRDQFVTRPLDLVAVKGKSQVRTYSDASRSLTLVAAGRRVRGARRCRDVPQPPSRVCRSVRARVRCVYRAGL